MSLPLPRSFAALLLLTSSLASVAGAQHVDRSCKPDGPLRVELRPGTEGADGSLELAFTIQPELTMERVEWRIEAPPRARVLAGDARGSARPERDALTAGRVRVRVPDDARYTAVELVVVGHFAGADGLGQVTDERVEVVRAVSWGRPEPVGPVATQLDGRGERQRVVLLPAAHLPVAGRSVGGVRRSPVRRADVEVIGSFSYEDKAWNYNGWTGNDPIRPIRRAKIQVVDTAGTVLATGTSAQDGSFSIPVPAPGSGSLEIRVQAVADSNSDPSFQRVRVRDAGNNVYVSPSPSTYFIDNTLSQLDAGAIVVPKVLFGSLESNPFNIFDMAVHAWEYLVGPCGRAKVTNTVSIRWPGGSGSFASGSSATMANDDGYDDAVILHEIGHVVHNLYSDSDSPGGSHSFGDSDQDPRLSLGEGFASFWGGAVMDSQLQREGLYCDLTASAQTSGVQLRLRLEDTTPYATDSFGAADEVAVACTLYDIVDDENSIDLSPGVDDEAFVSGTQIGGLSVHEAWFAAFEGPVRLAPNVTLNDFWDGWFSVHGAAGLHSELELLYRNRRVQYFNDVYEPNNTRATAAPIHGFDTWSTFLTLYSGTGAVPVPGKFDEDWYSMELVKGSQIRVATRYPNGASDADTQADAELDVWTPGGQLAAFDQNSGQGRNGKVDNFLVDETGTWTFRVRTTSTMRDYGRYNYRVLYLFENLLPAVIQGPRAIPRRLTFGETATLSVSATDDQPLTYAWTPMTGGRIEGSGPSVSFVPPRRGPRRRHEIQVTITDSLGAVTGPLSVHVDMRVRGQRTP